MMRRSMILARPVVSTFLREPSGRRTFTETLAECDANGTDMASSLTSDFALLQSKLVKYRVVRLSDELRYVRHNPLSSFPSFSALIVHVALLSALYLIFRCLGRASWVSLSPPPEGRPALRDEPAVV